MNNFISYRTIACFSITTMTNNDLVLLSIATRAMEVTWRNTHNAFQSISIPRLLHMQALSNTQYTLLMEGLKN